MKKSLKGHSFNVINGNMVYIYIHIYYKHDDGYDKSTDYDDDHLCSFVNQVYHYPL